MRWPRLIGKVYNSSKPLNPRLVSAYDLLQLFLVKVSSTMANDTPASCLLFMRLCQLKISGKDINDLIDRIQSLSLEYKQASGRVVDDDALKVILINQAFAIPEYHLVVKGLTEKGQLGDYYTLAKALLDKWKSIR